MSFKSSPVPLVGTTYNNYDDDADDIYDAEQYESSDHDRARVHKRIPLGLAFLWTVLQLSWAMVLIYAAFIKIADQGIYDYVRHYTNFSWSLQALFYLVTAIDPLALALGARGVVRFETAFIGIFLMPLFGIVVVVAILVIILLATRAQEFIDIFNEYPSGIVIIGNDFYHFFPIVALLFYIMFNQRHVFYSLNSAMQSTDYTRRNADGSPRRRFSIALFLYQAYFGTVITLLIYATFFDPREVYGTMISLFVGVVLIAVSLTVSNAIPLAVAAIGWNLGSLQLDDRFLLGTDRPRSGG